MGVTRFSEAQFLALLLLMIVTAPFVENLPDGNRMEVILLTLVLLSAVVAVGGRRRSLITAVALVIPAAIGKWLHHLRPDLVSESVFLGFGVAFAAFVVIHHLLFILAASEVDARVLCAGVSTYLMLGLLWAFAYALVANRISTAFAFSAGPDGDRMMSGFTTFYYSFTTLTSTGYGDITPVAPVARMLSILEAVTGAMYMAILIARLVAMHVTYRENGAANHDHSSR
jgi:hypothetical protein